MAPMPWIPLALFGVVMVLVVVFASRYQAEQQERFRQAWREFATSRGFTWTQGSGPWYRRSNDSIDATVEGVPVRLDTYVVSTGKTTVRFTRVTSRLEREVEDRISICRRSIFTGLGERFGRKTLRTSDPAFDRRMAARSRNPGRALRTIDEDFRTRLLEIQRRVQVKVDGASAVVTWHGGEKDPRTLDAACRLAAALSRASARA
jgi:hypothetical protein